MVLNTCLFTVSDGMINSMFAKTIFAKTADRIVFKMIDKVSNKCLFSMAACVCKCLCLQMWIFMLSIISVCAMDVRWWATSFVILSIYGVPCDQEFDAFYHFCVRLHPQNEYTNMVFGSFVNISFGYLFFFYCALWLAPDLNFHV